MGKGLGVCLVGLIWFGSLGFSFPSWGVGEGLENPFSHGLTLVGNAARLAF